MNFSLGTITSCKAQEPLSIESIGHLSLNSVDKGVVAFSIWNRCITVPITRSMWILTMVTLCVSPIFAAGNWALQIPLLPVYTDIHNPLWCAYPILYLLIQNQLFLVVLRWLDMKLYHDACKWTKLQICPSRLLFFFTKQLTTVYDWCNPSVIWRTKA